MPFRNFHFRNGVSKVMAVDLPVELILGIIFETTERLTTQNILEKSEVFLSFSIMNERKFQKHKSKSIKFCSHIQFHYFTSLKSAKHIILRQVHLPVYRTCFF